MKTQLDKGILKKPSLAASAQESGAISFSLCRENVERKDEIKKEFYKREERVVKDSGKKCHRWTQTEVAMPSITSSEVSGSIKGNRHIYR